MRSSHHRTPVRGTTRTLLATALALALGPLATGGAQAHGGAAHMVPLKKTVEDFGATVRFDSFANVYTVARNGTLVRIKPGSKTALINGQPLQLDVPVVLRKGAAWVPHDFINQVFQSSLDRTFVVERTPNPLNPLSAEEIQAALETIKASGNYKPGLRFTEITLKRPPKDQV